MTSSTHYGVGIRPLVSWPRNVAPGGSYVVSIDITLIDSAAPWPYDEEELLVGCQLDGRPLFTVRALDDAGVVLHRFGGTYGPARFLAEVPHGTTELAGAALWLTLTTAGGVPFYTCELPLDGTAIPDLGEPGGSLRRPAEVTVRQTRRPPPVRHRPATTLVIRIDEPSEQGEPAEVHGFELDPRYPGSADLVRGRIPLPLGPLAVDGEEVYPEFLPAALDEVGVATAGRYLWNLVAVAAGPVGSWWEGATATASGTVRTLLDIRPAYLRQLPWELMQRPDGERVFLSTARPWARGASQQRLKDLNPPLRLLMVLPETALDVSTSAIYGIVGTSPELWDVEILTNSTPLSLREALARSRPHVLHLVADATTGGKELPSVVMPGSERSWLLTTSDLRDFVDVAPRLVVLNTCTVGSGEAGRRTASAFTDMFLDLGCAAVISMRAALPPLASAAFDAAFYRAIMAGESIDVATALGRREIFMRHTEEGSRPAWAVPSLHLTAQPDAMLRASVSNDPQRFRSRPYADLQEAVRRYVDRANERRMLVRAVAPDDGRHPEPFVRISGERGVGKTAVVQSVLVASWLRGLEVTYVNLEDLHRSRTWLSALRQVRDALADWLPQVADEPIARFDHELAYLKERREPPPYTRGSQRTDDGGEFNAWAEDYPQWVDRIFAAFRHLLVSSAADRPLVLALDHADWIVEPDFQTGVLPGLLEPARDGELYGVRLLVVTESSGRASGGLEWWDSGRSLRIRIEPWPASQLEALVAEHFARQGRGPLTAEARQLLSMFTRSRAYVAAAEFRMVLRLLDEWDPA